MPLSLCWRRADGGSGHTCPDREAIETPRSTPPLVPTNHHHLLHLLLLSEVHKRPQMTSDPTGIHSDWGKVLAVSQQEQCSVVTGRKKREGMQTRMEGRRGETFSTSPFSFPPSLSLSFCPSVHTNPSSAVSQRVRKKQGAYFSIWGDEGIGHGSETIQPLKKKNLQRVESWLVFKQWKRERRRRFIHAGRQRVPEGDTDSRAGKWRRDPKIWGKQETGKFSILLRGSPSWLHLSVCTCMQKLGLKCV